MYTGQNLFLAFIFPFYLHFKLLIEPFAAVRWGAKSLQSCPTLCNPVDYSRQAPVSMGFSRQEYWSGLPCPLPREPPHPEIQPMSLVSLALASRFFTTSATWETLLPAMLSSKPL